MKVIINQDSISRELRDSPFEIMVDEEARKALLEVLSQEVHGWQLVFCKPVVPCQKNARPIPWASSSLIGEPVKTW